MLNHHHKLIKFERSSKYIVHIEEQDGRASEAHDVFVGACPLIGPLGSWSQLFVLPQPTTQLHRPGQEPADSNPINWIVRPGGVLWNSKARDDDFDRNSNY